MNNSVGCLAIAGVLIFGASLTAEQSRPIFDGKSLDGWTTLNGQPVTKGWEVIDGMIHLNKDSGRAGNIVTEAEYRDFELSFEWKNVAGGNNGIKYRVRKYGNKTLGCEYQIIDDDGYRVKLPPKGSTGSLYDIYEPNDTKVVNPPGEFNQSRIVVQGNRIEHWLNGHLIVLAVVGSDQWNQRIATSKFSDVPEFGQNREGKIMLTDHNSEVWYRNIELTPLPTPEVYTGDICQPVCRRTTTRQRILRRLFCRRR